MEKKAFPVAALNLEHKSLVVHVTTLSIDLGIMIRLLKRAQIAHLKVVEAPTEIPSNYADFADVF